MNSTCKALAHARGSALLFTALVTAAALRVAPASAEPKTHDGFYFAAAVGPAYLSTTPSFDPELPTRPEISASGFGVGGMLLFGGTPAPGLVVGGGSLGAHFPRPTVTINGNESESDGDFALNLIGPFLTYYLEPSGGLHGLLLLGFATAEDGDDDTEGLATGVGAALGVGYDFWVADELSVGVLGRLQLLSTGVEQARAAPATDVSYTSVVPALTLSITYH